MTFSTDNLLVRATERVAYGYIDTRAHWGPRPLDDFDKYPYAGAGAKLWPFDAKCRGYDMALFSGPWVPSGGHLWPERAAG
jgi:hypothetical protein